jgi:autotransporter-associated beta strand protein
VESGWLYARLAGNGTMTKTTDGEVIIRDDNSNYSGTILLEEGTLTLGDGFISSPNSLGTGSTIVKKGGRLVVRSGSVNGRIVLAGGEVLGLGSTLNQGLTVIGDGGSTRSTLANTDASVATTTLNTTIAGALDVAADAVLEVPGARGTVTVTGDAHVDGSVQAAAGGVQIMPAAGKTGRWRGGDRRRPHPGRRRRGRSRQQSGETGRFQRTVRPRGRVHVGNR